MAPPSSLPFFLSTSLSLPFALRNLLLMMSPIILFLNHKNQTRNANLGKSMGIISFFYLLIMHSQLPPKLKRDTALVPDMFTRSNVNIKDLQRELPKQVAVVSFLPCILVIYCPYFPSFFLLFHP